MGDRHVNREGISNVPGIISLTLIWTDAETIIETLVEIYSTFEGEINRHQGK
jgi:hypothetical protein